jgi:hypothetical protein
MIPRGSIAVAERWIVPSDLKVWPSAGVRIATKIDGLADWTAARDTGVKHHKKKLASNTGKNYSILTDFPKEDSLVVRQQEYQPL